MEFKRDLDTVKEVYFYFTSVDETGYGIDTRRLNSLNIHDVLTREENGVIEVKFILERPGILIGRAGRDLDKLEEYLSERLEGKVKVLIEEFNLWNWRKYK